MSTASGQSPVPEAAFDPFFLMLPPALRVPALILALVILAIMTAFGAIYINSSWYLGNNNGTVGIYQGINEHFLGIPLSHLEEATSVSITDLPMNTQESLKRGLPAASENEARKTVESYRDQINSDKSSAAVAADRSTAGIDGSQAAPQSDQAPGTPAVPAPSLVRGDNEAGE